MPQEPTDLFSAMIDQNRKLWSQYSELFGAQLGRREGELASDYYRLGLNALEDMLQESAKLQAQMVEQWFAGVQAQPMLPEPAKALLDNLHQGMLQLQQQRQALFQHWLEQARQFDPQAAGQAAPTVQPFAQFWQGVLQQAAEQGGTAAGSRSASSKKKG